jgi:ectoine hydroxylase-related dioxygenase (phytanoyl-CoA dioxygenase family)
MTSSRTASASLSSTASKRSTARKAKRPANLVDKGDIFREVFANPEILRLIGHLLRPRFKLSSLNARSANPNDHGHQPLHVDQGLLPDAGGPVVANVVWMLDDFTPENGAMRAVPRTHLSGRRPQDALADPNAPHPDQVLVTGRAGTICVMNAHLWHGGTANRTAHPRRAIHSFYCRHDVAQQQYQKRLLRPEVQAAMPQPLRELLALDDPFNDELCAQVTSQSGFLK